MGPPKAKEKDKETGSTVKEMLLVSPEEWTSATQVRAKDEKKKEKPVEYRARPKRYRVLFNLTRMPWLILIHG